MQTASGASLSDAAPQPARPRRGLIVVLAAVAVAVIVVDQASKALAAAKLTPGDPIQLVGDLLRLDLIRNPGAAFSLATGMTWVLTVVAIGVVVFVVRSARRLASLPWAVALGLLLGGAIGNLTDRLLREPGFARGHVVDFIAYGHLFIGNVADIAIVVAAGLIVVLGLRGTSLDGRHPTPDRSGPRTDDADE
ncbi:signal peptidase II [Angustibacter sp. McL0619]|uniref:signal peptidase II n=1 Tax=Angustibacter sp. McL0619 TaxID=3415676 RepID=UPI003CE6BB41